MRKYISWICYRAKGSCVGGSGFRSLKHGLPVEITRHTKIRIVVYQKVGYTHNRVVLYGLCHKTWVIAIRCSKFVIPHGVAFGVAFMVVV